MATLVVIRRSSAYLPCHIRKLLYQSFVLPHLDYCSVVWNSCGATLSGQIDRIQNYALRMILQKPPLTPSIELRRILGWCSLETRRQEALLCQVHRCLSKMAPTYLCSKFRLSGQITKATTRGTKLFLQRPNTSSCHSTFEFQGAIQFNKLPETVRTLKSLTAFKTASQRTRTS